MLDSETASGEQANILGYLNESARELDEIIRKITQEASGIIEKYPPQDDLGD